MTPGTPPVAPCGFVQVAGSSHAALARSILRPFTSPSSHTEVVGPHRGENVVHPQSLPLLRIGWAGLHSTSTTSFASIIICAVAPTGSGATDRDARDHRRKGRTPSGDAACFLNKGARVAPGCGFAGSTAQTKKEHWLKSGWADIRIGGCQGEMLAKDSRTRLHSLHRVRRLLPWSSLLGPASGVVLYCTSQPAVPGGVRGG